MSRINDIHTFATEVYNTLQSKIEKEFPNGLDYCLVYDSLMQLFLEEAVVNYIMHGGLILDDEGKTSVIEKITSSLQPHILNGIKRSEEFKRKMKH